MIMNCDGCLRKHNASQWKAFYQGSTLLHICSKWFSPSRSPEIVPQRVKDQRAKHFKSTVQPWRGGYPSREFMDLYPEKSKKLFSSRELLTAKNTWKGEPGWNYRDKTY